MRTGLYALVSLPLLLVCLAWDVVKLPVALTFFLLIYIMGVLYYIHKAWGVEMLKDRSI